MVLRVTLDQGYTTLGEMLEMGDLYRETYRFDEVVREDPEINADVEDQEPDDSPQHSHTKL